MYKPRYQVKRLIMMIFTWWQMTRLYFIDGWTNGTNYLVTDWHYKSPKQHPFFFYTLKYHMTDPSWAKDYRHEIRTQVKRPRDIFDQLADVISGVFKGYWQNVFVTATCSHPHSEVYIEWEGDREEGYYDRINCLACHSDLISAREIDRYLPPRDRHPELTKGNPTNPMDRPKGSEDAGDESLLDEAIFEVLFGKDGLGVHHG